MVSVDPHPMAPTALPRPSTQASPLARQGSIYSLTLDEFQSTLCEPGKNFGSMNMDEFLSNIWTAEESQAMAAAMEAAASHAEEPNKSSMHRQPSLPRQNSLTIPAPLSQKTVEEVWSDIHGVEQANNSNSNSNSNNGGANPSTRQPTFGEMTLEDFLVKAGVVRDGGAPSGGNPTYEYPSGQGERPGFGHVIGMGYNGNGGFSLSNSNHHQQSMVVGEGGGYGKRGIGGLCMGGRMGNGGLCIGSPVSPLSSEGMCAVGTGGGVEYGGGEMGGGMRGGRKRVLDAPVEKVVERRQRRMIKNRESAARSRARKQAYTVELEAELNQLKEENAKLRKQQEEATEKRRKKLLETLATTNVAPQGGGARMRTLRRTFTGPW
ncbi:protein ABSCISIC ACID-INSENSITIVE 5 [Amborella trichopoda]|nr:protein ABSCISIC ACID-INSENSITIVE 5 [Amborella trichopoda]|eukprot:XP_006836037.3 protein ABSCISIC ACID-INSENSITIVE 5 [Amborella trichopoda]